MPVELVSSDGYLPYFRGIFGNTPGTSDTISINIIVATGDGYNGRRFVASGESFGDDYYIDIQSGFVFSYFSNGAIVGKLPFGGFDETASFNRTVKFKPGKIAANPTIGKLTGKLAKGFDPNDPFSTVNLLIDDALASDQNGDGPGQASLNDWRRGYSLYSEFDFPLNIVLAPDPVLSTRSQLKGYILRTVATAFRKVPGDHP